MSTGWLQGKYDVSDKPYCSQLKSLIKPSVKLAEEHPTFLLDIYDQKKEQTVVPQVRCSQHIVFLRTNLHEEGKGQQIVMSDPSRLFV